MLNYSEGKKGAHSGVVWTNYFIATVPPPKKIMLTNISMPSLTHIANVHNQPQILSSWEISLWPLVLCYIQGLNAHANAAFIFFYLAAYVLVAASVLVHH